MASEFESAQLILKLYELRRDPVLRQARAWFVNEFNPTTFEELLATVTGEKSAWFRMVLGYWDMAASLVTFGAIDSAMFRASSALNVSMSGRYVSTAASEIQSLP